MILQKIFYNPIIYYGSYIYEANIADIPLKEIT